ncbi:hypothetical protein ACHQM5_009522 [Ranunculus cassubicifolius]
MSSYPFIFSLFIFSFFTDFPVSLGEDYVNYTICSQQFNCGGIINVSYPFWGDNRPRFCGHPAFELKCNDDLIEIDIDSKKYRVLDITDGPHTLQIAPLDLWGNDCSSPPENISLRSNQFNYSLPQNQNLTLAYGCSAVLDPGDAYQLYCPGNNIVGGSYFSVTPTPVFSTCRGIAEVPILELYVQDLLSTSLTVEEVLKRGFLARYDGNASFCDRCENSGGQCGYNFTTIRPTCLCYDGEYPQICPIPRPAVVVTTPRNHTGNMPGRLKLKNKNSE